MQITEEAGSSGGRYIARIDGKKGVAEMTYSRASPTLIIIDHTGVPDTLRGMGVGEALARHAIEQARTGGWKIIPLCPFMKAQMARNTDWQDVLNR